MSVCVVNIKAMGENTSNSQEKGKKELSAVVIYRVKQINISKVGDFQVITSMCVRLYFLFHLVISFAPVV